MGKLPQLYINTVAAFGHDAAGETHWSGTGFLFGKFVRFDESSGVNLYDVFFVTNKHVIADLPTAKLRFNPKDGQSAKDFPISLIDGNGNTLWTGHPDPEVDVAVLPVNINYLESQNMISNFFEEDNHVMTLSNMEAGAISEGDDVFALGFPGALIKKDRQYVIVRNGIISRIQDIYEKRAKDYLIDSFVFPGNSGGPVITKSQYVYNKSMAVKEVAPKLIGIVKAYIPFKDVAYSRQTNQARVIFEENTGLSIVEPVDHILETIEYHQAK